MIVFIGLKTENTISLIIFIRFKELIIVTLDIPSLLDAHTRLASTSASTFISLSIYLFIEFIRGRLCRKSVLGQNHIVVAYRRTFARRSTSEQPADSLLYL